MQEVLAISDNMECYVHMDRKMNYEQEELVVSLISCCCSGISALTFLKDVRHHSELFSVRCNGDTKLWRVKRHRTVHSMLSTMDGPWDGSHADQVLYLLLKSLTLKFSVCH